MFQIKGAGGGLGRAIAERFAQQGCVVVVTDLKGDGAKETCEMLQKRVFFSLFISMPINPLQQRKRLTTSVIRTYSQM